MLFRRKSAKELFNELGFRLATYDTGDFEYFRNGFIDEIIFNKYYDLQISIKCNKLDKKLVKAINRQIEELGWLNKR